MLQGVEIRLVMWPATPVPGLMTETVCKFHDGTEVPPPKDCSKWSCIHGVRE